tara:strand:+ start:265 stop:567 length:303 start_codon:yes stop_codon:yes gene_type:complete
MSKISPKKRKEPIEEEVYECGGCHRPEWNCYCRTLECICCGETDHRYNMRSNMEINEDFYTLPVEEQDRNCMCMSCINNDSDEEDSDDWHDQQESDEEEY